MDVLGKTVLEHNTEQMTATIDMTSAGKGIYMVIVEDNNGNSYASKLVVE